MRKLFLLVSVSALVVGCGGGSSSNGSSQLSGRVGNRIFTPLEVRAIPAGTGSTPCSVTLGGSTVSVGIKAIAIDVTSYTNACGDFPNTGECVIHADAQNVTILVAKVNPLGTEPALATGVYTLNASPTTVTPDGTGLLNVGFAQALGTNSSCGGTPSVPASGTVRLDSVGDPVTGHVSVTFQDGSTLDGDFSAPACAGLTPDICQFTTNQSLCTGTPTCM